MKKTLNVLLAMSFFVFLTLLGANYGAKTTQKTFKQKNEQTQWVKARIIEKSIEENKDTTMFNLKNDTK